MADIVKPYTLINEAYFTQYSPIPDNSQDKE